MEAFRKKIDYFGKEYAESIKADPMKEALNYANNVTSARYINKKNQKQNKIYNKAFSAAVRTFIHFNKPLLVIKAMKRLLKTQSDPFVENYWSIKAINYCTNYSIQLMKPQQTKKFPKFQKNSLKSICQS